MENNLAFHPALTECPSGPVLLGESFLQVKDLGLIKPPLDWNFQRMLDAAIAELPTKPDAIRSQIIQALKEIAARHNLDSSKIPDLPSISSPVPRNPEASVTSHGASFHIDTRSFNIESISEATRFYGLLQHVAKCLIETRAGVETARIDAEARAEEASLRAYSAETQAAEARALIAIAEANLAALRASRSWRVTKPLRIIDALARGRVETALKEGGLSDQWVKRLQKAWARLKSFRQSLLKHRPTIR